LSYIQIEDPFEQPDNAARAVGSHNLKTIAGIFHVTHQLLSSSSVLSDRNSLLYLLSRPLVSSQLSAPIYTQQANMHQYPNVNGDQQIHEHVAKSSPSQDRTTRTRTTGKVYDDPNQSSQLANGSNLSQKSKQNEKLIYHGSSFRVPENQVYDPNLNSNYRIGLSDLNHSSQPINGSSKSSLGERLAEYCVPSVQIAKKPHDAKLTHNHRNSQVYYSAHRLDQASQDYVVNLNQSRRIRSAIVEPKHDNLTRNHRNNQMRFAGQTSERFDWRHNSGSRGVHRTEMTSWEPSNDPSLIRSQQSHPLVGYSTTRPGNIDQDNDASMERMNRMHTSGFAIVEPVSEQLNHSLKLNGQSYGSNSKKGKQIWQPKFSSNQVFL
jgi:hypothetical protein